MGHAHNLSPEEQRSADWSVVKKGFVLLLIVTVLEVLIALVGNGHIGGMMAPKFLMIPVMVILSLYKGYYIVSEFMHLGHETKGMAASVILPLGLLFWAIIAFLWEGDSWKTSRDDVKKGGRLQEMKEDKATSSLYSTEEINSQIQWS